MVLMRVELHVEGQPIPQPRPRVTVRGATPHAYVPDAHPIHAWRKAVELEALKARHQLDSVKPCSTRCVLLIECVIGRPKGHWRKATLDQLIGKAPEFPSARTCGDVSNHLKGIEDAIVDAGLIVDDGLVGLASISKRYALFGEAPHARIVLEWEE